MKAINLFIILAIIGLLHPLGRESRADHIPQNILEDIEREANLPACLSSNRDNGTNYNCYDIETEYLSCWTEILSDEISYQEALDLLGQLKVSNTYYDYYYQPETNPYISEENLDTLMMIDFICW